MTSADSWRFQLVAGRHLHVDMGISFSIGPLSLDTPPIGKPLNYESK